MIRRRLVVVLVGALAIGSPPARASSIPIDTEQYLARLQRADALAIQGTKNPSPELMARLVSTLGFPIDVVTAGGRHLIVSTDVVLQRLPGDVVSDFERARARLAALAADIRSVALRSAPPPDRLRSALRHAYQGLGQPPPSWLDRIRRSIGEAIGRALNALVTYKGTRTIVEWLAILAVAFAVLVLLIRGRLVPERRVRVRDPAKPESSRTWAQRADDAVVAGDLREAVRALYQALLASLSARGVTSDIPSLTAGECRDRVAGSRPTLYPLVAQATGAYERITFGGATPDLPAVEVLRQATHEAGSA